MSEPLKVNVLDVSDEYVGELNKIIQECLNTRIVGVPYDVLFQISEKVKEKLRIKWCNYNLDEVPLPLTEGETTEETTKRIALDFFKSIDQEFYKKALAIVNGENNIKFEIYSIDDKDKPCDSMLWYDNKGKATVKVIYEGKMSDIYTLVHELSHSFDLTSEYKSTNTRMILSEITPHCFELMLDEYLVREKIITQKEASMRRKTSMTSHFKHTLIAWTQLKLMEIKEKRNIEKDDILRFEKTYGLDNINKGDATRNLKYMIAGLISFHYIEQYEKNPQEAIKTLKQYFEMVKSDNLIGSLETLGINTNPDLKEETIAELISGVNKKMVEIERVIGNEESVSINNEVQTLSKKKHISNGITKAMKKVQKTFLSMKSVVSNAITQGIGEEDVEMSDRVEQREKDKQQKGELRKND